MLGKEAQLRNRQRDLRQFIRKFCPDLDKTRRRFFSQALWGILMSQSLVVARWLRWIKDHCHHRFWRHKRLLNQLHSHDWDTPKVQEGYQRQWAQGVQVDTPLIVDLCDLARPRARKLKYLALVRDGSEDKLVYGYWCLEIYAYWGKGCISPLLLHPYSIEDPKTLGENAMILRGIQQVLATTEGRGVLIMDAGADRDNLLIPWIDDSRHFVVRLRGDRHLRLENGSRIETHLLAERLLAQSQGRTAWCKVFLPERPKHPLALVCKTLRDRDRPLILLSSLSAADPSSARQILQYYRQRWKCEEAARFLKSQLGLERFALRTYECFGRLMLLATLAMSFLTWLQLAMPTLNQWLAEKSPGRHEVKFTLYRMLQWLQEKILPDLPACRPP